MTRIVVSLWLGLVVLILSVENANARPKSGCASIFESLRAPLRTKITSLTQPMTFSRESLSPKFVPEGFENTHVLETALARHDLHVVNLFMEVGGGQQRLMLYATNKHFERELFVGDELAIIKRAISTKAAIGESASTVDFGRYPPEFVSELWRAVENKSETDMSEIFRRIFDFRQNLGGEQSPGVWRIQYKEFDQKAKVVQFRQSRSNPAILQELAWLQDLKPGMYTLELQFMSDLPSVPKHSHSRVGLVRSRFSFIVGGEKVGEL